MPTYLVETYMMHGDESDERERRARQAAAALTRDGTPIAYRGLVHIPDDELCVIEFDAKSYEHTELAARRAGLDPLRIVRAVSSGRGGGRQPTTRPAAPNADDEPDDRTAESYRGNFARLREVKAKYDPHNLFRVHRSEPTATQQPKGDTTMSTLTPTRLRPTHARRSLAGLAALALAGAPLLACGSAGGDRAHAAEPDHGGAVDAITVEMLTPRAEFTDEIAAQIRQKLDGHGTNVSNMRDASRIAVAKITIQPGAVFPWHTHPGPVLITIADGDFVYRLASDCVDREYTAGDALVDIGGDNVHTAYNPSGENETVVIATFLDAPADGPLTVRADAPEDCALPTPSTGSHRQYHLFSP